MYWLIHLVRILHKHYQSVTSHYRNPGVYKTSIPIQKSIQESIQSGLHSKTQKLFTLTKTDCKIIDNFSNHDLETCASRPKRGLAHLITEQNTIIDEPAFQNESKGCTSLLYLSIISVIIIHSNKM